MAPGGRPGFNLDATFKGHTGKVKAIIPTRGANFVSYDSTTLKIWQQSYFDAKTCSIQHEVTLPHGQPYFISAICYAPSINHILAACLDNTLKAYSDKVCLHASIAWANSTVTQILYNSKTDEVITAGETLAAIDSCKLLLYFADSGEVTVS